MMRSCLLIGVLELAAACGAQTHAALPFQGCASDGQVGPVAAPQGKAPALVIPATAAARLAWYKAADTPGVLAPRGWHCFATYGSNGATLYVTPEPSDRTLVFRSGWPGFRGPAVQVSSMSGSTSGRFEVAKNVARYFPAFMPFAKGVIDEGLEPATDFPRGSFPQDRIVRKNGNLIEYETPANTQGEGTQSRLRASDQPIVGFVFVSMQPGKDPYDVTLFVRLASEDRFLAGLIRNATESTVRQSGR